MDETRQALLALVGSKVVAYHVVLARLVGSAAGGLLLGQMLYWSERTTNPDNWFWKTRQQWRDELGLTRREQEVARKRLRQLGILEERRHGIPPRLHFRVDVDRLISLLAAKRVPINGSHVTDRGVTSGQTSGQKWPYNSENTTREQAKNGGGTDGTDVLVEFGVSQAVAKRLAAQCSAGDIIGWLAYAEQANGLQDRAAFVVSRLRDGEPAPEAPREMDTRSRYLSGKYGHLLQH